MTFENSIEHKDCAAKHPFLRLQPQASALGSQRWLWDAGLQAKVSVLGVGVALSYGRDLDKP
jgi:hypothetical protein